MVLLAKMGMEMQAKPPPQRLCMVVEREIRVSFSRRPLAKGVQSYQDRKSTCICPTSDLNYSEAGAIGLSPKSDELAETIPRYSPARFILHCIG